MITFLVVSAFALVAAVLVVALFRLFTERASLSVPPESAYRRGDRIRLDYGSDDTYTGKWTVCGVDEDRVTCRRWRWPRRNAA